VRPCSRPRQTQPPGRGRSRPRGAAIDRATRAANRTLARQRATSVRFYLRALRVKGIYAQVLVTKKGKPKGPVAAQAVIIRKGIPRTTVTIAFRR